MHTDSSGGIAADRREQQQMRKKAVKNAGMIRIYLNMAWKLLQKNLLSIVIFETVYRLFSSQLVSRLANAAINFSLKQLGTSYMTSENSLCVPARGPGFSTWQRASRTFGCTAATAPSAV